MEIESISPLNPRKQTRLARERNRWSILDAFPPSPSPQIPLGLSNVCWALTGVLEWKFNSKAEYRSWHDSGFYPVMGHMLFFFFFPLFCLNSSISSCKNSLAVDRKGIAKKASRIFHGYCWIVPTALWAKNSYHGAFLGRRTT